jgi:hypothetical protein
MHENKIFFLFLKREINSKVIENVLNFFFKKIFQRKPGILIPNLCFTM